MSTRPISVLIVEDDPLIAEAHQTYLSRLTGFATAAVAHTARDAMRAASEAATGEHPIDLVLLDLGLPDATGISLASALSGLRPAPDIIAITSGATWRWCGRRYRTARWRTCSNRSPSRRSGTGWSATGATATRCPRVSTRPARPRSTGPSPNSGFRRPGHGTQGHRTGHQ